MFRLLFSGLTATVLIGFGLFMVFAGRANTAESAAMLERGVVVDAAVTKLELMERRRRPGEGLYTAHLRFQTREGRVVTTSLHVMNDVGRALRSLPSPTMKVRYLPEAPATVRPVENIRTSGEQAEVGVLMILLGALMFVVRFILAKRHEARDRAIAAKSRPGPARSATYSR
jgi:hypothetical protein